MGMNLVEALTMFVNMARNQHGSNFDPGVTSQNMMGRQYSSPKDALDAFLREGKINQQQYDKYVKMI